MKISSLIAMALCVVPLQLIASMQRDRTRDLMYAKPFRDAATKSTLLRAAQQKVLHDGSRFHVMENSRFVPIQHHDVDPIIRNLDTDHMRFFKKNGYIKLSKASDDYVLRAYAKGNGGWAGWASVFYWGTKALLYGGAATAIPTVAVTFAPAVATAGTVVLGTTVTTAAANAAIGTVMGGVIGGVSGGGTVAGTALGVVGAVGATSTTAPATAATAVGAVVLAAGGITQAICWVEAAALFMGSLGALIPGF